jgi:parallel beta-helix repeat protein
MEYVIVPKFSRIFKIHISDKSKVDSVITFLSKVPGVLYAEKNMDAKLCSDPSYSNQWYLNNTGQSGGHSLADIRADSAWQIFTGSSSIKIGIFDSGVELAHSEFQGKITGDAPDAIGSGYAWAHRTHLAGIAASKANNDIGGRGVDWNAQINSRKIFNGYGGFLGIDIAANQIINAVNSGVQILDHSWIGDFGTNNILHSAFAFAYKMNCITCAAMGNGHSEATGYPAGWEKLVIAVGATRDDDTWAVNYSNRGNHIDVAAPGGINMGLWPNTNAHDIWSTWLGNSYDYLAGTSMSTAIVSGIASLLKGYNYALSNDDITNIIRLSADKVDTYTYDSKGWNMYLGYGRVNALKALRRLRAPFTISQSYTIGGTDQGASSPYSMSIYDASGLVNGTYTVKKHEIRKSITYNTTRSLAVWGRGAATVGWADEGNTNFSFGWCAPVPGTITSTGATLRSYVYEVFNSQTQTWTYYPTTPANVTFNYTVHGIPATITSNTTWEGVFIIDGDVTVNSGVTLNICPKANITFINGASLILNGTLTANGSTGRITFNFVSKNNNGITVNSGGTANISYSDISYALNGINFNQGVGTIDHCTFTNCTNGVQITSATPTIQYCTISNNSYGIKVTSSYSQSWTARNFSNNTISGNTSYGLYLYNSSPTLTYNTINGNSNGSTLWYSSNPILNHNIMNSNTTYCLACYGSASPSL